MGKNAPNPGWTNGTGSRLREEQPTAFELLVADLKLSEDEYAGSMAVQIWVKRNRNHRYVPEFLLHAFGLEVNVNATPRYEPVAK